MVAKKTFSRKATQTQTGGGSVQDDATKEKWNEWKRYIASCNKTKPVTKGGRTRREKVMIGKVNYIIDLGFPKAADGQYDLKDGVTPPENGEKYSPSELAYKEKNPTHDFVWVEQWDNTVRKFTEVRKQTSPSDPQQEYGICVDFPAWLVDYSKHPNSTSEAPDLRPYRISLNGDLYKGVIKDIKFQANYKSGLISDKNLVYKICKAAGREQELIDSGFDIGTAAEAVCNFKVVCDLNEKEDGSVFINCSASTPARIDDIDLPDDTTYTAEAQIEKAMNVEGMQPFVGILLDMDEYTDDMLKMVGVSDTHNHVARASTSRTWLKEGVKDGKAYSFEKGIDYSDTPFAKAYEAWKAKQGNSTSPQATGSSETKVKEKPKQEVKEPVKVVEEPVSGGFDFDETIPFSPLHLLNPLFI